MKYLTLPSISALTIWVYGMYLWMNSEFSGPRSEYIGLALTGFMLFVLLRHRADQHLKGLAFYSMLFGFIGLLIMVFVIRASML